jgi:hypothetical protein
MKDYKTGSYDTENLLAVLEKFSTLERLNMFTYEAIIDIEKLCTQAVLKQVVEACKDMPYNGRIEFTGKEHASHYSMIYRDNNLKLGCSIYSGKDRYTFDCYNILEVKNDSERLFKVECIISTQEELKSRVNKVLSVINEGIKNCNKVNV